MATRYKFEYNGNVYEVEGPENATPEQLIAAVSGQQQPQMAAPQPSAPLPREAFAPQNAPYDVTQDMSGGERYLAGFGQSLARTELGFRDLFGRTRPGEVEEFNRVNAPLLETGAGFLGSLTGDVAQIVGPGGILKAATKVPQLLRAAPALGTASRAFLPTTITGAGAQGAAVGALQPTEEEQSRLTNAAFGAGLGAGGATVGGLIGAGVNAVRGSAPERQAARVIREAVPNIDEIVAAGQPSRVPGVTRTLAEETLDSRVVNLDRGYRAQGTTALSEREAANNAARVAQLQRIAGSEDDLLAAIRARDAAAEPIRREALRQQNVDITKALDAVSKASRNLEGRPLVRGALTEIQRLLTAVNRTTPGTPASAIVDASGNPIVPATPSQPIGASMADLYEVRKTIGDMLEGRFGGENAASLRGMRELIVVRDALDNVIGRRVPEFKQYLETYKRMSGPVNRLQFGQELMRTTTRGAEELTPSIMPGAFMARTQGIGSSNRRAGANRLAQQATGFNRASAANVLSPDDVSSLLAIRDDIGRQMEVARIASRNAGGGSQTALMESLKKGMVRRLADRSPTVGAILNLIDEQAQQRVAVAVADALANPNQARAILARFPKNEQQVARQAFTALGISTTPQAARLQPSQ